MNVMVRSNSSSLGRPAPGWAVTGLQTGDPFLELVDLPVQFLDPIDAGDPRIAARPAYQLSPTLLAERHFARANVHADEAVFGSLEPVTLRILCERGCRHRQQRGDAENGLQSAHG